MSRKDETWRSMNKKKYELEEKMNELEQAKEAHRESLVDDTVENILTVFKEEGKITERDLKLFLGDLARQTMQLYNV